MRAVGLFTKAAANMPSLAFHQGICHAGEIDIAYNSPLIRYVYFGTLSAIAGSEVFVFHAPDEYHLVRHYLPELPADNLIQMEGEYDLLHQFEKFAALCRDVDFDSPFVAIPLDHFPFTIEYFRALNASMTLAEKSGSCSLLGNLSHPEGHLLGQITNGSVLMEGAGLTVASLTNYLESAITDHSPGQNASQLSWDCGVLGWRAIIASTNLENDNRAPKTRFSQLFDFNKIASIYVVKGQYGYRVGLNNSVLEAIPYGSPDLKGNRYMGAILPPNSQSDSVQNDDLMLLVSEERVEVVSSDTYSLLVHRESNASLEDSLAILDRDPGLAGLAQQLRQFFKS